MTLNKPKINTDQNLVPNKLIYKYMYQRSIFPILISVITIVAISFLIFYGVPYITSTLTELERELSSQSLENVNATKKQELTEKEAMRDARQEEYDNYYTNNPIEVEVDDSHLAVLREDIARLEQELKEIEDSKNVVVFEKYHINELFTYIEANRPADVVVVSLEDKNSQDATGEGHLIYQNDVGQVSFSLHGMATSSQNLSTFLTALNDCPYIQSTKIISVETHTMSDSSNLYVFEVSITPLVTVEGE